MAKARPNGNEGGIHLESGNEDETSLEIDDKDPLEAGEKGTAFVLATENCVTGLETGNRSAGLETDNRAAELEAGIRATTGQLGWSMATGPLGKQGVAEA